MKPPEAILSSKTHVKIFAPLGHATFRNIWIGSLFSSTGLLIQGVGAAWAMTEMAGADMVALVQTATFLPMMFFAIAAGAFADMYDRRKVQILALIISLLGATVMTLASLAGYLTPWPLLFFCFCIGSGMALFAPAWQSSAGEQVPQTVLPNAIALNSAGYNVARSFGPAVGGAIVAAAGVTAAFAINALFYLPLILILLKWRRVQEATRLPPERVSRAIMSGLRYVLYMRPARTVIIRTIVFGLTGSAIVAMMPLLARNMLAGNATTYGVMLGSFGIGAVLGVLSLGRLRLMGSEKLLGTMAVVFAICLVIISFNGNLIVICAMLITGGYAWTIITTVLNTSLQLCAPRWVVGRVIATFQASMAGGIAIGSWLWGIAAENIGEQDVLLIAAILLGLAPLIGLIIPVIDRDTTTDGAGILLSDPDVQLGINGRSGPIAIEVEYSIALDKAREFHHLMQEVQHIRSRNGAYGWMIARDLANPELWVERYWCPTWHDYLHQRNRSTLEEQNIQQAAMDLHIGIEPVRVRRMLERPYGSVRWRAETPDRNVRGQIPITASSAGGT